MTLKGNLFVKIFVGFWLVTTLILGSWLLAARYFESLPDRPTVSGPMGPPRQFMLRLFYELQNVADAELPKLLRKTKQQHDIDVFLLNSKSEDLYHRELVPGVLKVAEQLRGRRRRTSMETPHGHMLGHIIHRDTQGLLRAVVVIKPPKPGLVSLLNRSFALRLTLAVLISGLVCFVLSRAMTNRIKALQLAARQLADGDLDTRIKVRERGGDETDELARDFNTMAGQLKDKIQAQKRLLGDVSHELRSPLARLRIALALAQEDPRNGAKYLQRIDLEAERLEALIRQLLSSQNGEFLADVHIDLVSLLVELCADASFEGEGPGKRVEFSTRLEQAVIASHADLLKKCFENIIGNALKYTAYDTTIEVTLIQIDDQYEIRIEDRGPGVEEAQLDKLFEEFYRADSARQRETGGYGLGLAIAKRAVLQHQGTISAVNTGTGLAVTVTFPIPVELH